MRFALHLCWCAALAWALPGYGQVLPSGVALGRAEGLPSTISYQWQVNTGSGFVNVVNGGGVSGATTASLNISSVSLAMNANVYRCVVSTLCTQVVSSTATLAVSAMPSITTQPASQATCVGTQATFSALVGDTLSTCQWQVYTGSVFTNVNNGAVYNGANTPSLTVISPTVGMNGNLYRFVVYNGCGTVYSTTVTLAVSNAQTTNQAVGICPGQSFVVGTSTYTTAGTYVDVLTSAAGCDSTVTTNLAVGAPTTFTQNPAICPGGSFNVGGSVYTAAGTYVDVLTNAAGCDSTVTTNLSLNAPTSFTQNPTICQGQSFSVGSSVYTASGTYTDVLTNAAGCDSTVTTNLSLNAPTSFTQNPTICQGQSFSVGSSVYTASGTYTDVLTNAAGCDSTVTSNLTVQALDPTVTLNGGTLTALATMGSIQWMDCDASLGIPGETSSSFTPVVAGNYAAVVTVGGCSDTSDCFFVEVLGSAERMAGGGLRLFPNPTTGLVTLECPTAPSRVDVLDVTGRVVHTIIPPAVGMEGLIRFNIAHLSAGLYTVRASTASGVLTAKLVRQ